jgi:hypothetical protein
MIKNIDFLKQPVLFYGINNGSNHPTDIDAVWRVNQWLIIFEFKYKSTYVKPQQKTTLQEIAKSWHLSDEKKLSWVLYCRHDKSAPNGFKLINTDVFEVYHKGENYKMDINTKKLLLQLANKYHITPLKNQITNATFK